MPLPDVRVKLSADGTGEVLVDGVKLPGVTVVSVHGSVTERPQVAITLTPNQVLADLTYPAVQILRLGGAVDFADAVNAARLEELALDHLELHPDATQGEAFAAAVATLAAEFERTRD